LKKASPASRIPSNHHLGGLAEDDAGDCPVLQQSTGTGSFQIEEEGPFLIQGEAQHPLLALATRAQQRRRRRPRFARSGPVDLGSSSGHDAKARHLAGESLLYNLDYSS
jgi:hypothetical protein